MKLIDSPVTKSLELNKIIDFVGSCETIEDTAVASKLVDSLQKSQPEEKEVIQSLRDVICDMSFDFFIEKYKKN